MSLLWRGLMANPLTGHCAAGQDGWCNLEAPFPARQAVVQPDGTLRLEVRFGDKDPRYSEQRALLTAVNQTTFHEGDECWIGWSTQYQNGYVQKWPKEDELDNWPASYHSPGSCLEWHHAPSASGKYHGDWNLMPGGSAPIYTGVNANGHYLSLVKSITESVSYKDFSLPLVTGQVNHHVMHVKWSADPAKGLLEYWVNGVSLGGPLHIFTLFPDCDTYLTAGTYRRLTIGDPSLLWPSDAKPGVVYPPGFTPRAGQRVFPKDDGYPGVLFLGPVLIGTTSTDVGGTPVATTPPAISLKAAAMLKRFIDQQADLLDLISMMDILRSHAQAIYDKNKAILDAGPPW